MRLRLGCLSLRSVLGFEMADVFSGDRELKTDFLEQVMGVHPDPESREAVSRSPIASACPKVHGQD